VQMKALALQHRQFPNRHIGVVEAEVFDVGVDVEAVCAGGADLVAGGAEDGVVRAVAVEDRVVPSPAPPLITSFPVPPFMMSMPP